MKNRGTIFVLILLAVGFYFFHHQSAAATPVCPIGFTEDVILDLDALDTTFYIASGSETTSMEIDKAGGVLTANGICDGSFFLLRTAGHNALRLAPTAGTADLVFSSVHETVGYVSQWNVTTTANVAFVAGVPLANTNYAVELNGVAIPGSPFNSGVGAELNFTSNLSGTYTIEEMLLVETLSAINIATSSATLRGKIIAAGVGNADLRGFEWGTTTAGPGMHPNSWTEGVSGNFQYGTGLFRRQLTGLVENQTYFFRAKARNAAGWGYGEEKSFVTREGIFIIVEIGDKTRIIEIDREGRIIIQRE